MPKNFKNTSRRTRVVGHQEYINKDTNELITCQVVQVEQRDINFKKIWIAHLLEAVEELGSKKIQLLMWMFDNADAYNRIIATVKKMTQETGISHFTIKETLKSLEEKDIITRPQSGVITINPDVIFRGTLNQRMNILLQYKTEKEEKLNGKKEVKEEHISPAVI